jgi:hypothetical protein
MSVMMSLRLFAAASVLCGSLQDVELAFLLQTLRVNLADPPFELLSEAAFAVYNKKRRLPLLGANARNEYTFRTPEAFHDALI